VLLIKRATDALHFPTPFASGLKQPRMMFLTDPHREDVELPIAWEHRIERAEIAKRFLHHLSPRIDEDPMHGGRSIA
jgi:hypothetical protein